jgi:hypothetical protein
MQSDDLTAIRLREVAGFMRGVCANDDADICEQAAAAIERLVAERDRLAEALKPFRLLANCTDSEPDGASVIVNVNRARDARQALKGAP